MISAGNDIVSLTATNVTRTKSPEFYSKIISPAEKALFNTIDQAVLPFDRFVWLLWSVKESAYKYLHRLDPGIVFTPVKFEVQSIEIPPGYSCTEAGIGEITGRGFDGMETFKATVAFGGRLLFSRGVIHNEFVSFVVNDTDNFSGIYWGIRRIEDTSYKYQSAAIRDFILKTLCPVLGLIDVTVEKDNDEIPVLSNSGKRLDIPVSLSHHERWIAYSFQLTSPV